MEAYNFISFPRSGSHYLNNVLRTYLGGQKQYTKYISHDHDEFLRVKEKGSLYLKRDKLNTAYSYLMATYDLQNKEVINFKEYEPWVLGCLLRISEHRKFYLSHSSKIVEYDLLISSSAEELWPSILFFFGLDFVQSKMEEAINQNSKERLAEKIDSPYMNKKMLSKSYQSNRVLFTEYFAGVPL